MMKKTLACILSSIMALSMLSACAGGGEPEQTTVADVTTISDISGQSADFTKTAMDAASEMGVGWNVGNSLDATGKGLNSETAWGNPKITKELIDAIKAQGFDTVRIPITWMGHFDEEYTIDEDWLNRVDEVIGYVIDNDMYAIINIHHDGMDYGDSWLTPEPADEDGMVNQFTTIWSQIATRFEKYGEKLLYAGMNEFHKGYGNPTSEYIRITDRLNQAFVDTVRATGGNNAERILIVQAYNTNATHAVKSLTMPTDSAKDKLMAEVHYYDPWNFAGEGKGTWGIGGTSNDNWGQEKWVDEIYGKLKATFVDNGVPVIIGEYGAVRNADPEVRRYYIEYVTKAACENGCIPIWWDNGHDGDTGESFALINRISRESLHQDIIDAIMRASSGEDYEISLPNQ